MSGPSDYDKKAGQKSDKDEGFQRKSSQSSESIKAPSKNQQGQQQSQQGQKQDLHKKS